MRKLTKFRVRWMDGSGLAVVERAHERLVLGFWPVYEWEAIAHFPSRKEASEWIIDRNQPARSTP